MKDVSQDGCTSRTVVSIFGDMREGVSEAAYMITRMT